MKPTEETRTQEQPTTAEPRNPEQEQLSKVSRLQNEILDSCYKAEEITKALEYLLTCPPEYSNFDPCPLAQAITDYLEQIEQKANELTKA